MNFDLTITISVILALSAIISPIIVSIINNHYLMKNKRFETYDLAKIKALEEFCKMSGEHLARADSHTLKPFFNSLYALLPYFSIDEKVFVEIEKFKYSREELSKIINRLLIKLSKQVKSK